MESNSVVERGLGCGLIMSVALVRVHVVKWWFRESRTGNLAENGRGALWIPPPQRLMLSSTRKRRSWRTKDSREAVLFCRLASSLR